MYNIRARWRSRWNVDIKRSFILYLCRFLPFMVTKPSYNDKRLLWLMRDKQKQINNKKKHFWIIFTNFFSHKHELILNTEDFEIFIFWTFFTTMTAKISIRFCDKHFSMHMYKSKIELFRKLKQNALMFYVMFKKHRYKTTKQLILHWYFIVHYNLN